MRNAPKVLIVDDDKASLQAMSEVVKRIGLKPITANKPMDALNVVRLQTVHAAIVDVLLPKMTGVELVDEFRKTKFADNPVIFVSGVFKDKNFTAETLKKTNAVSFLFKPFSVDDLAETLNKSLQHLLVTEKWSVQSIITRNFRSNRERVKAIENLEPIKGLDFPFVLSILMEAGSSGNLNIVNESGEIFGITLTKGAISELDSTESQSTAVLALIYKGFLSQEDWDGFQKTGQKKFSVEKLVELGYVSPHAISDARREQIVYDFRSICSSKTLQVNYMPHDESEEAPKHAVILFHLMKLFESDLNEFYSEQYLKDFYSAVKSAPLRTTGGENMQALLESDLVKKAPALMAAIEKGQSFEQALAVAKDPNTIYHALNFLVLNRAVIFDDVNRAKDQNLTLDHYKKLYEELKNKTPDKVFEYFGAKNTSESVILNIFNEFTKSMHPNQLGKDASPELVDLAQKVFQIVSEAKDVLTDEAKKIKLFEDLKTQQAEKQFRAQKLTTESLEMIRKGQAKEALAKLTEADSLSSNTMTSLMMIWAEVKASANPDKIRLHELGKKLDLFTPDERKSAFYYMAYGLVKKAMGDASAVSMFEKALQMDPDFVEARRELNSHNKEVAAHKAETKKLDLFTGDLSEIVSQIFKRKAE